MAALAVPAVPMLCELLGRPGLDSSVLGCLGPAAFARLSMASPLLCNSPAPWDMWLAKWQPPSEPEECEAAGQILLRSVPRAGAALPGDAGWEPLLDTLFVLTAAGRSPGIGRLKPEHNLLDLAVELKVRRVLRLLLLRGYTLELLDAYSLEALVQEDDFEGVLAYLEAGTSPDIRANAGRSVLMVAAAFKARAVVPLLLEWGANVHQRSGFGSWTALMWAAHVGWTEGCSLLLRAGARLGDRNAQGLTASDIATRQSHFELAKILEPEKQLRLEADDSAAAASSESG